MSHQSPPFGRGSRQQQQQQQQQQVEEWETTENTRTNPPTATAATATRRDGLSIVEEGSCSSAMTGSHLSAPMISSGVAGSSHDDNSSVDTMQQMIQHYEKANTTTNTNSNRNVNKNTRNVAPAGRGLAHYPNSDDSDYDHDFVDHHDRHQQQEIRHDNHNNNNKDKAVRYDDDGDDDDDDDVDSAAERTPALFIDRRTSSNRTAMTTQSNNNNNNNDRSNSGRSFDQTIQTTTTTTDSTATRSGGGHGSSSKGTTGTTTTTTSRTTSRAQQQLQQQQRPSVMQRTQSSRTENNTSRSDLYGGSGGGGGNGDGGGDGHDHGNEDEPKAVAPPHSSSMDVNDDKYDRLELTEDAYNLLFVARTASIGQLLSILAIAVHVWILTLLLSDSLQQQDANKDNDDWLLTPLGRDSEKQHDDDSDDESVFHFPVTVPSRVFMAQLVALVAAATTQENILVAVEALLLVRQDTLHQDYPNLSFGQWILANLLRLAVSLYSLFLLFVLVFQSETVHQILIQYLIVVFLECGSRLLYQLAWKGYFGESVQEDALTVKGILLRRNGPPNAIAAVMPLVLLAALGVVGASIVRTRQNNGYYHNAQDDGSQQLPETFCRTVRVQFGDQVFSFDDNRGDNLAGRPLLHYAYFSGTYKASWNGTERPIYYEETVSNHDSRRGMFYYCEKERAWHFTIAAGDDIIPVGTRALCDQGWLLQSPVTDASSIDRVSKNEEWIGFVEGRLETMRNMNVHCAECQRSADCNFHGQCEAEGQCACQKGWHGSNCQWKEPSCTQLILVNYGNSANDYSESGPYIAATTTTAVPGSNNTKPLVLYERQVYVHKSMYDNDKNNSSSECGAVVLYAGLRWHETNLCWSQLRNSTHVHWDSLLENVTRFSEPTDSDTPVGIAWNEIRPNGAQGSYGPWGATRRLNARFECSNVTCVNDSDSSGVRICGSQGICVQTDTSDYACLCRNYSGGFFCEFESGSEYSASAFAAFQDILFREGYPNVDFEKLDEFILYDGSNWLGYYRKYWQSTLASTLHWIKNSTSAVPSAVPTAGEGGSSSLLPSETPSVAPTLVPSLATDAPSLINASNVPPSLVPTMANKTNVTSNDTLAEEEEEDEVVNNETQVVVPVLSAAEQWLRENCSPDVVACDDNGALGVSLFWKVELTCTERCSSNIAHVNFRWQRGWECGYC